MLRPKGIAVKTYEELVSKVLECLRDEDVCDVCVDPLEGFGASAVLRRAAEAVEKKELIEFDTAIKLVPLAAYRSPREAQRAVAEQLNLEPSIMAKFDEADEDDDFSGVPASERGKVTEVAKEIYRAVKDRRVLLVCRVCLADGSTVIDFNDLGIPILGWGPNKVLWTVGREFPYAEPSPHRSSQLEVMFDKSDAILNVWKYAPAAAALECAYAEAVEIARYVFECGGRKLRATPSTAHGCLWYLFLLDFYISSQDRRRQVVDYLVCEQILQGEGDHAACREIGKAVARMVLPLAKGRDALDLLKQIIASRELRSSVSPELLPPKILIIDRNNYKHEEYWRHSSQQEGSYRWMAVKNISPDDPELRNSLIDNIWRRDDLERGTSVFCNVSSVFWKFEPTCRALPDRLFERCTNVRVLDLFGCVVGPIDSAFVHLRNLRMLRMEKCQVTGEQYSSANASPLLLAQEGPGGTVLFDSLWVLILYNSDADKFLLAGRAFDHMPNLHKFDLEDETFAFPHLAARKGLGSLRKLRINCPVQLEETDDKSQVFDPSENTHIKFLPKLRSTAINLKKLNLEKCEWLESLNLNHLPATIEAVSLRSCRSLQAVELEDPTSLPNLKTFRLSESERITQLSLQGCRKLEQVDLRELLRLEVLDLSGTAVKALEFYPYDEKEDTDNLPRLKKLYLLGCEQLRRLDLRYQPRLDALYLDNYGNNCSVDRCLESFKNQTEHYTTGISDSNRRVFQAHIVVRDARLLRSFPWFFFSTYFDTTKCHIHIHGKHSSTTKRGDITDATTEPGARITSSTKSSPLIVSHLSTPRYTDVLDVMEDHRRPYRPSPPAMPLNRHIEVDGGNRRSLTEEESFTEFMKIAESLFVHENTSALAVNDSMSSLKCCRIENCPNMEFVVAGGDDFLMELESMWLSHLPRLNAVRKRGIRIEPETYSQSKHIYLKFWIVPESYSQLKHIYLEFCARIRHVLPSLSEPRNLETIDIRCCGELRAIFVDYDDDDDDEEEDKRGTTPKLLPKLRSIHLEELPKLQHIYKPNICAPSLQDIVIRGCSSLRKLPLFDRRLSPFDRSDGQSMRVVKISCEKDWWDNLNWYEPEANYFSFRFDPKHCPFY